MTSHTKQIGLRTPRQFERVPKREELSSGHGARS
jgi:hypothetical protein